MNFRLRLVSRTHGNCVWKATIWLFCIMIFCAGLGGCAKAENQQPSFTTYIVQRASLVDSVLAAGRLQTLSSVNVSSQLSGRIEQVLVDFNDTVIIGQVLAVLDQQRFESRVDELKAAKAIAEAEVNSAEAAINGAEAKLAEDRRDYQGKLALAKNGSVSKRDLERARSVMLQSESELAVLKASRDNRVAALHAAIASLRQSEIDLERTVIKSPIDGIVINRSIEPGQTVAASLEAPELFTIAHNLKEMEVYASVDEADIGKIKKGQTAKFTVDAYPGKSFAGTVRQIRKSPQISQNVVTYGVVISARNPGQLLLPGMTALVKIVSAQKADALLVPNAALRFDMPSEISGSNGPDVVSGEARVWLVESEGNYVPRLLSVGYSDGEYSEVISGEIQEGQTVVIGYR